MPSVPYKWRLMIAVPLAIFMVILDGVAVSVALPSIMNDFNVGLD